MSPKKETEEPLDMVKYPYRRALGQILYLANTTCPDLSNAARELGAASSAPTMRHWKTLQHVLRYMHTNPEYGLRFPKVSTMVHILKGFTNADFAGNEETRKPCTGYVIKLGIAIITWVSRTQRTVTTSTTEAEWTALYEGVRQGEFIRKFLQEIGFCGQLCRSGRIRIDNTRLFLPPPTTTLMTSDVVVNQLVLFTMLQSFFRIPEE